MDDLHERQIEVLKELLNYDLKLLRALPKISWELTDSFRPDTLYALNEFLNGVNWVIEVTNLTLVLINKERVRINSKQVSNTIKEFNIALADMDCIRMAMILENGIQLYLEDVLKAAMEVVN